MGYWETPDRFRIVSLLVESEVGGALTGYITCIKCLALGRRFSEIRFLKPVITKLQ